MRTYRHFAMVAAAGLSVASLQTNVTAEPGVREFDDNYIPRWKKAKRKLRRHGAKLRTNMNRVSRRVRRKHRRAAR